MQAIHSGAFLKHGVASLAALAFFLCAAPTLAESIVTVAMTAGDIPITTGIPDQGGEGARFVGYNLYDSLLNRDLSRSDVFSDIKSGLAETWKIDPANPKRWIFSLRHGVRWHDGCQFNADDVVWNFQRVMDQKAPQFDALQFALARTYLTNVAAVEKVDDYTVAMNTFRADSLFPYQISQVLLISRCQLRALNYDNAAYAMHPSGTGPYRFSLMVPHERLELVPNRDYWDPYQRRLWRSATTSTCLPTNRHACLRSAGGSDASARQRCGNTRDKAISGTREGDHSDRSRRPPHAVLDRQQSWALPLWEPGRPTP